MVAEGLLPKEPHATQRSVFESHLKIRTIATKFTKHGLPLPLTTPERKRQKFKSRK